MKMHRLTFLSRLTPVCALCFTVLLSLLPPASHGANHVVACGNNFAGQTNVPPSSSGAIAVAAGSSHSLALRENGRVVAWGWNINGQTNVPIGLSGVRAGHSRQQWRRLSHHSE
jgi:alpha-tubulin suppressor-like RCC1 family protein